MSETEDSKRLPESEKRSEAAVVTRRDFLNEVTAGALGITGLGSLAVTYQYFSPNVLFEPPTTFRAGNVDLFPVNSVTFFQEQLVYIVRMAGGFYAISAVCTHLGCITQWKPEDNLVECPCHGSKFKSDGTKVAGPAPRPLPHFLISLSPEGELVVNKLETVNPDQILRV